MSRNNQAWSEDPSLGEAQQQELHVLVDSRPSTCRSHHMIFKRRPLKTNRERGLGGKQEDKERWRGGPSPTKASCA